MQANYKDKLPKKETEVALGNLYDMNKQIMATQPPLDQDKIDNAIENLLTWVKRYFSQSYFMMLCHERRDYTVFRFRDASLTIGAATDMAKDVVECLQNRGELMAADLQPDDVWEFWIKHNADNECSVYYLFPYGEAVLEY